MSKVEHLKRGMRVELPATGGYGGLAAKPPATAQFLEILGKKSYFNQGTEPNLNPNRKPE